MGAKRPEFLVLLKKCSFDKTHIKRLKPSDLHYIQNYLNIFNSLFQIIFPVFRKKVAKIKESF